MNKTTQEDMHSNNQEESDLEKKAEELAEIAESETKQLEALETELASLKEQWLRAMAETENLRRRAQKDREEALKYASANFAREMIVIADNLRRALETCPEKEQLPESIQNLIAGVELTENELLKAFEKQGIKKITPELEKFDPHYHQAMFEIDSKEHPAGTILQVLQPGYVMHDRLLRPALVAVAKS